MKRRRAERARSAVAGVVLAALTILSAQCTSRREGIVVSTDTGEPIPGAFVDITSAGPFDDVETNCFVVSDERGRFVADVTWDVVSARAWKPGYALNGNDSSTGDSERGKNPLELRLRPLTSSALVGCRTTDFRSSIRVGEGVNMATGEIVPAADPTADFAILGELERPASHVIVAFGNGGLVPHTTGGYDWLDFRLHNTPEAPETGYVDRSPLRCTSYGVYDLFYVRMRDGRHYGKVRLRGGMGAAGGAPSAYDLVFAYQPDGTRELELEIDQEFPFPLEMFGIDRKALPVRRPANRVEIDQST